MPITPFLYIIVRESYENRFCLEKNSKKEKVDEGFWWSRGSGWWWIGGVN